MAQPDYVRPELLAMLDTYAMLEACYEGERAIKATQPALTGSHYNGGSGSNTIAYSPYLPDPSPRNEDYEVRKHRYNNYLQRAVFYNVTRRTVSALVGQIFSKYPTYDLNELSYLESDVDGAGQSLVQQAKDVTVQCLLKGGGGLLADMPVNEGVTKASMANGGIRPIIKHYQRESIINWRVVKLGSVYKLGLLVLAESYVAEDDGYKQELGEQLLVLRLTDGLAESEIIQKIDGEWVSQGVNPLLDSKGSQLTEIPFYFYGAVNNDAEIDSPPLLDIATLNIHHFMNSADMEEMLFLSATPTLVVSGLDQQWAEEVLSGGIAVGSRSGIMLPVGGNAQMLQISADSVIANAMAEKEQQMKALGAKLIESNSGQSLTATEAQQNSADETSVLSTIANNISDAYTKVVRAAARYAGADDSELYVTMNTQFDFTKMTTDQLMNLMSLWQGGAITFDEMRSTLVENETAIIEDPKEAKAIIDEENAAMIYDSE